MSRIWPILGCLFLAARAIPEVPASGLRLVGSAQLTEKMLRLTAAQRHQAGAAWFEEKQ